MSPTLRSVLPVALLVIAAWALRPIAQPAAGLVVAMPTPESRARTFAFEGVAPGDRDAILTAVAAARPEAQRLIGAVAGLVTVRVGKAGDKLAGTTKTTKTGYEVMLDLGPVSRMLGQRGIERLVLHELGHVVDFALVPDATISKLDAGIPPGYGCEAGHDGACATPEERFAESFAKWAADDIGVNLSIGYKVPPPALPLAAWAEPLTRLPG